MSMGFTRVRAPTGTMGLPVAFQRISLCPDCLIRSLIQFKAGRLRQAIRVPHCRGG